MITLPSFSIPGVKLAIIGEAPTDEDITIKRAFTGTNGRLLHGALSAAQLASGACLMGYARSQPFNYKAGNTTKFGLLSDPLKLKAHTELRTALLEYQPNCVLLLGAEVLQDAGIPHTIDEFRGSLFECTKPESPFFGFKCVASYAPSQLIRNWDAKPLFDLDVRKAVNESGARELVLPQRVFDVELTFSQILDKLNSISSADVVSIDIEGGIPNPEANKPEYRFPHGVTCVGISTRPDYAFIVNLVDFGETEQCELLRALGRVLGDPSIKKVLQNSLYDNFVLSWLWKMPIRNVAWDTMLSSWEIYPELPKSLGVQASVWTREPYYKYQRTVNDKLTHYRYCCMDAAITLEIAERHHANLKSKPRQLVHFNFNMSLLPALHYMELRGLKYDKEAAQGALSELSHEMKHLQLQINTQAGGELNVNSPKQMQTLLYAKLGFEPQYKLEGGRKTTKLTTDVEALLSLFRSTSSSLIFNILKWRQLESSRKQLEIECDPDGRIRTSYNLVGTDTGRLSSSDSPTGTGFNLQTIMEKLRYLYRADDGMLMFQCDLSGADGWTVAAECKGLGDPTMWDDYVYGMKPAKIIAAMYIASMSKLDVSKLSRADLNSYINSIDIPPWLYAACKAVQHGSNYGMKEHTMSSSLLKQSWKKSGEPIYVAPKDCGALQMLYLYRRYIGVPRWHEQITKQLNTTGRMECASGHVRQFFGRKTDTTTINAALSQQPQANTTYATNLALQRLWTDPENRRADGTFRIEPLHQVHDALIGQFAESDLEWAKGKIREYFNNPITIAGTELVIPFEGGYGKNWLDTKTNKL